MPQYFLTVRIPAWLTYEDASDAAADFVGGEVPFYRVKSKSSAMRLLELFKTNDPKKDIGFLLMHPYSARMMAENKNILFPAFSLLDDSTLGSGKQTRLRDQTKNIEDAAVVQGPFSSPYERILNEYHLKARQWEADETEPREDGLPIEIGVILNRGNFSKLTDDEYAKLGAWLEANRRKAYQGMDPASLAKARHMEEVKNRLRTILEYNVTFRQSAAPESGAKEQPWADEAPEYLLLSQARKLIDNHVSLQTLGRLCKPNGRIRYMRKGRRCKVHVAGFLQYMKGQQSDPIWAAAYMLFLQGEKTGKTRLFWKCQNTSCAYEYPENASATDRCPKCKGECVLTQKGSPKPNR